MQVFSLDPHALAAGPRPLRDRFELHREIGAGSAAKVYAATDRQTGGAAAVKVLTDEALARPGVLARFRQEAQLLDGLDELVVAQVLAPGAEHLRGLVDRVQQADRPTQRHGLLVDVHGVAWLTKYVQDLSSKSISSMIVSHDSVFLDNVAQDMVHYEKNRKLKVYKGNLSEFVKLVPEAAAYYQLESDNVAFSFPDPGMLESYDSHDCLPCIAPRALCIVNGALDPRCPMEGLSDALRSTRDRYAVLGCPERFDCWVEEGVAHECTRRMQAVATAWLLHALGVEVDPNFGAGGAGGARFLSDNFVEQVEKEVLTQLHL